MRYWINLFTWKTWQEFKAAGGTVSGFRESRWRTVQSLSPGDQLLCYLTGISRFFAILEVTGQPFRSNDPQIWNDADFPCRVPVKVVLELSPEYAIPVVELKQGLSYFDDLKTPHAWTGHFRGSPTHEKASDAHIIINALREAQQNPVSRSYDERKLHRSIQIFRTKSGTVSIPDNDPDERSIEEEPEKSVVSHEEIQWLLLYIGQEMGLDLWVARNDQNKSYGEEQFQSLSRLRSSLPVQFDEATNRTIELIDVLWLSRNSIIAAFEIEHTTAVYSGLLRMADLITMQPNLNIPLFIVAPDERQEKVQKEINRPIFSKALRQPLPKICRYIPYSALQAKVEQAKLGGFLPYLRPDFLDEIAEDVELEDI